LKGVSDTIDKNRLCGKRGLKEKIAAQHQKKLGETVNRKRAKDTKPVFDVGEISFPRKCDVQAVYTTWILSEELYILMKL
jgi:hypothetical protein